MAKVSKMQQRVNNKVNGVVNPSLVSRFYPPPVKPKTVDMKSAEKKVIFMSRNAASFYQYQPGDVLISVSDSGKTPPDLAKQPAEVLALDFHDEVYTKAESDLGWRRANMEDGAKIAEFVLKHTDATNILIHCNYGEQRSKGIAFAISDFTGRHLHTVNSGGSVVEYNPNLGGIGNDRLGMIVYRSLLKITPEAKPDA